MTQRSLQMPDGLEPSPCAARNAQLCLELAALLGDSVDREEWLSACELAGLKPDDDLIRPILVHRDDKTWAFADAAMRRGLIEQAGREGRLKRHHAACARALFLRHAVKARGVAARRVTHLCEAGLREQALAPILIAAKETFDCGDFEKAGDYLDLHEQILDDLSTPAEAPARAQNAWRRAWLHHTQGEHKIALELVDQSREVLELTDWADERGHLALLHGRIVRDEGDFETARRSFDEAVRQFAVAGDDHGLAQSRASRGYVELQTGEYTGARRSFLRALAAFETLDDRFMVASLLNMIAQTWLLEDNQSEAMECVARARQVAREAGHKPNEAFAWMVSGEMARTQRDWEQARACYLAAAELYEDADNRSLHITRYNLALVEIGARNFEAALELLVALERCYPEVGFQSRLPLVYVGMMSCAAGAADWQGFSHHLGRAVEAITKYSTGHPDIVWMAREAMALADERDHGDARQRAGELACAQLQMLERHDQADELRACLGR